MSKYLKNLHKPCDKLDKYDNEPYMKNPLLKLNLAEIRKYRRQTKLEDSAVKVRASSFRVVNYLTTFFSEQD